VECVVDEASCLGLGDTFEYGRVGVVGGLHQARGAHD